ncbi:unnamed protein product [Choristocarpus tenellus]
MRHFQPLFNTQWTKLDTSIPNSSYPLPPYLPLANEPIIGDVSSAVCSLANQKAVGPDGLPVELLNLGLDEDPLFPEGLRKYYFLLWSDQRYLRSGIMLPLIPSTRRRIELIVRTTGVSLWYHMLV